MNRSNTTNLAPGRTLRGPADFLRLLHQLAELTKVRLVTFVAGTAAVGYLLGAGAAWSPALLAWTVLGTGLAAAGAMALNEWMEAGRDALMERTRLRPIPAREISPRHAALLGAATAAAGLLVLALTTNLLTAALGATIIGLYLLVYTPLKSRSPLCTLAGAVCGAIPPMMGWSSATGALGFGAWLLATVLFLWQIPHFLALAWLYRQDYERGGFRMLPLIDRSGRLTSRVATLYAAALIPVALSASIAGIAGWIYGGGSLVLGLFLVGFGVTLVRTPGEVPARRLFLASLAYLPLLLALLVADRQPAFAGVATAQRAPATAAAAVFAR
ncbi:MAG: heme o synthase [Acidobacteriota bacterium]